MSDSMKPPKVFISYAWEDDIKKWVHDLATRLRADGVETILDQWGVAPGDSLPQFMENSVNASDFVLVVCTPSYKRKSDSSDPSGVGYEKGVITGELFVKRNQRKFIPILRKGQWLEAAPPWVLEKIYIDLRDNPYSEHNYQELLRTLYNKREPPPPMGTPPDFSKKANGDSGEKEYVSYKLTARKDQVLNSVRRYTGRIIGGFFAVSLLVVMWIIFGSWFDSVPTPTPRAEETVQSFTPVTAPESLPSETSVVIPSPTVDSQYRVGTDGMNLIYIPAGEFQMGSSSYKSDERPVHTVYLDSYFIDQTEVTNSMYALCVDSGKCEEPTSNISITQNESNDSFYFGNPKFDDYPVIYVSWNDAKAYCESVGRRLPTEAEWEKAATWENEKGIKRIYPWGNSIDCSYANYYENGDFCVGVGDTGPVGGYLKGSSFFGVLDMAGNVWEWVADRYAPDYYEVSPPSNPRGPDSGDYRVIRGGSFLVGRFVGIRSSDREKLPPKNSSHNVGFRCAVDPP